MSPNYFPDNSANQRLAYIKSLGKLALGGSARGVNLSNSQNVNFHKPRPWIPNTLKSWITKSCSASSFFVHICNVIGLSSNKKMGWPYTNTIVAFMKHKLSFWDLSKMKLPRKTMSRNLIAAISYVKIPTWKISPVLGSGPIPAFCSFAYLFPEALVYVHRRGLLTYTSRLVEENSSIMRNTASRKVG